MIDKQKKQLNMKVQWTKLSIVLALYLLFLLWVKSWWGLLVVPFIFDVYITKKIRWHRHQSRRLSRECQAPRRDEQHR